MEYPRPTTQIFYQLKMANADSGRLIIFQLHVIKKAFYLSFRNAQMNSKKFYFWSQIIKNNKQGLHEIEIILLEYREWN